MFSSMASMHAWSMMQEAVELLAAVEYAMAHRADLGNGGDDAVLLGQKRLEHEVHGLGVVLDGVRGDGVGLVAILVGELAALDADALDQTLAMMDSWSMSMS